MSILRILLLLTLCVGSVMAQTFTAGPGLGLAIPDNTYNGTFGSMLCNTINVPAFSGNVDEASVQIAMSHTFVGDLTIKLVNPVMAVATLVSRPGVVETADDGNDTSGFGENSNLAVASPLTYIQSAPNESEMMGKIPSELSTGDTICAVAGSPCSYNPNKGSASSTSDDLTTAFDGAAGVGNWMLCIGDSAGADTGALDGWSLTLTANANTSPTISDVSDQSIDEDSNTGALAITVGDAETPAASLTMSGSSNNTALVPNNPANISFGGSGANRTVTVTPIANQSGTATITLTVSDANSGSASDTFVLTVNPVADTPSVTNATTNEDTQSTTGLVISRNAADGAEVTHFKIAAITTNGTLFHNDGSTAIAANDFITFEQANAGLKFTPAANFNGSGSFALQASISNADPGLGGGTVTATITVNPVNDPPSFNIGPNRSHPIGTTAAQSFADGATAIDDGDAGISQALTFNVSNDNNSLFSVQPSIDAGGTLTYTPAGTEGSASVSVTLSDDATAGGAALTTVAQTFVITVNANTVPTISDVSDQNIVEDGNTAALAITVGDAETPVDSLTMSGSSDNTALVPNANIVFGGSGADRSVTVTPAANQFGTATVTVHVTDAHSGTATDTFVLTVDPLADTPSVTNASTNEDTQSTTGLVISRNVADGAEVTHFKITAISNGTLFQNDGSTAIEDNSFITFAEANAGLKFTPAVNFTGNGSFALQASTGNNDAGLGGSPVVATITVDPEAEATVYVSPTFNGASGLAIADADLGMAGNQAAIQDLNAFSTLNAGLAAVTSGGTVIVNAGNYAESVNLDASRTLEITGPDAAQAVIIEDLATAPTTTVLLEGASTLTFGDADHRNLAGNIGGSGSLIKQGSGTVILSGSNSYTGTTTVNAGTLVVDGASASGTSMVGPGNTLQLNGSITGNVLVEGTLSGAGAVNGAVTVASGGAISPGLSPGILNTGNLAFLPGSTFSVEINGSTPGTEHDQLNVTGTVDLGGATLALTGTIASSAVQPIVLVNNDGADAISGTFNGLAEQAELSVNGLNFRISYTGGSGNDVVLSPVVVQQNEGPKVVPTLSLTGMLLLTLGVLLIAGHGLRWRRDDF